MAALPGQFNVSITQDPHRILNEEHAKRELMFVFSENFGEHAYEKVAIQQTTEPGSGLIRTIGSVCILSLEEMEDVYRKIQNLEAELVAYKNMMGRAWK